MTGPQRTVKSAHRGWSSLLGPWNDYLAPSSTRQLTIQARHRLFVDCLDEAASASRPLTLPRFPLLAAAGRPEAHHRHLRPHQNAAAPAIAFDHLVSRVKRLPISGFKSAIAKF